MDPIFVIVLFILLAFIAFFAFLAFRFMKSGTSGNTDTSLLFQQQLDGLRAELGQSLKNTSDSLNSSLKQTTDVVFQSLKTSTESVNHQLTLVTNQLAGVTQQLQTNTGDVGTRLDKASSVIQAVQHKLGELSQATQEIKELGQSVSKLEEMLKAPKFRGGLGELLLEDLLKQVLATGFYETQHTFRNGQTVDAIIHTAGGIVPVDSKFPLENFRKMIEAKNEQEKKLSSRAFVSDVKKHIDAIADKYIVPDEGTFDFALMYIPAENIYYETIIKDEMFGEEKGIFYYAMEKHVVPVSPNGFYAHLMVIAQGLKGMQIERSAKEIYQNLQRLTSELQKFTDIFQTLGAQLNNAKNNFDKADKQLNNFSNRFDSIQSLTSKDAPKQLDAFSD